MGDIIVGALTQLLRILFSPVRALIQRYGDAVLQIVVGTPHPNAVFEKPTNTAWPNIHAFYWETVVPLSLALYGIAIGVVILLESTSHLFSGYHRSQLKRRAVTGLLGILSWWWVAALSLRFVDALTGILLPSVADISLFETLSFSGMGVLGLVVSLSVDLALFVLIGLIYLARRVALYLFVVLMPVLVVLWIPAIGPFAFVAKLMKRLGGFYVPALFMTVPVAVLLRLGQLLGGSAEPTVGGFIAWLTALVVPVLAILSPIVLFWQAGAIFFAGTQAARHVSARNVRNRLAHSRERIQQARYGSRNFVRGLRNEPAITPSGQYLIDSGGSRAHATGQRLGSSGAPVFSSAGGSAGGAGTTHSDGTSGDPPGQGESGGWDTGPGGPGSGETGESGTDEGTESASGDHDSQVDAPEQGSTDRSRPSDSDDRSGGTNHQSRREATDSEATDRNNLRDPPSDDGDSTMADDPPRYIQ